MSRARQTSSYRFTALIIAGLVMAVAGIEGVRLLIPQRSAYVAVKITPSARRALYPRELRDAMGTRLVIPARPQRIVSQTLSTDEILLAVCSPARIVGISAFALDPKYSNIVAQARTMAVPAVAGAEEILQLNPDLIFVASYSRAETVDLLRTAGAPVFRFANFDRIEDIKANIRTVGYATGDDEQAETVVAQMEHRIEAIRARLSLRRTRPRVMSYSPSGFTEGTNTLFDEMVRTVGAINVSAEHGLKGFPKISAEQVAAWQPDFLVMGADTGQLDNARRRLLANPAIASSHAGRAGRIIIIDNRYFLTVSHHLVRAIDALADGLYSYGSGGRP